MRGSNTWSYLFANMVVAICALAMGVAVLWSLFSVTGSWGRTADALERIADQLEAPR